MQMMIFGAGYSGQAIAAEVQKAGGTVSGTTRSAEKLASWRRRGSKRMCSTASACPNRLRLPWPIPRIWCNRSRLARTGDPLLNLIGPVLRDAFPALEWIAYLSTVGVYGDHGGGWVTEETPCKRFPPAPWSAWRRSRPGRMLGPGLACRPPFCACPVSMVRAQTAS